MIPFKCLEQALRVVVKGRLSQTDCLSLCQTIHVPVFISLLHFPLVLHNVSVKIKWAVKYKVVRAMGANKS